MKLRSIPVSIMFIFSFNSFALEISTGQNSLEFHGYFRSGLGQSESGSTQARFQAPGARAAYRLGNEPDTNLELQFNYKYKLSKNNTNNEYVEGVFLIDGYKPQGDSNDLTVGHLGQGYLSFNNFFDKKTKLWFGRRYYDRKDTHINDHTWLNPGQGSNTGFGFEDMMLNKGKINLALFKYEDNFDITGTSYLVNSTSIDLRWHGLKLNENIKYTLWAAFSSRHKLDSLNYDEQTGFGIGSWFDYKSSKTKNTTAFIFQTGPSITQGDYNGKPIREDQGWDLDNASAFEISNTYTYQSLPEYSLQWTALYRQEDYGVGANSKLNWFSIGARPVFYFSKHMNLAVELGIDQIDDELNNRKGSLTKLTTALQLAANRGLYSRPVIRFFVTFADWSDELIGLVGNSPGDAPYANDTQGWTLGAQAEVWW